MSDRSNVRPLRVLVVEDESMISLLLEDLLQELGHIPVGPAVRLDDALAAATEAAIDAAILDINLDGARTYSVADKLRERGIPFIFSTGYGTKALTDDLKNVPTLQKPFDRRQLERALKFALMG